MPKVSVIIPSLYEVDGEYLKLCVESLRATTDWQIIVVTNGSPHKPILPLTVHHLHTRDQGQCNAVNIGAQVVQGDYLMVSNSDMVYGEGWNKNLRFDYPVFSPNLIEPQNNLGSAPPFLKWGHDGWTLEEFDKGLFDEWMTFGFHKGEEEPKEEPGFNLPFFIKRDLWDLLGGYDVGFDPWGASSDTDLQMKIELAGVTPRRLRDVLVYHFSNKTPTFEPQYRDFWQHNWDYLQEKWGFNRDEAGSDTWYHKNMIMWDKLKYHPDWEGKYGKA